MALTQEQAFKVGFLYRCAEEGLTEAETEQRIKKASAYIKNNPIPMTKEAFWPLLAGGVAALGGGLLALGGKALGAAPSIASTTAMLGLGLPVVAGAGTGYMAAKLTGNQDKSLVEEAKQDEIIGEYERLADEARRRARIKKLQEATGRRVLPLSPSF